MTTITEEYRGLNEELHASNHAYGTSGREWIPNIEALASMLQTTDVLDYGCGKRTLGNGLSFRINEYDPAIFGLDDKPKPASLVVCTDVLEHIEPELLDNVLNDLQRVTKRMGFFTIATYPAKKFLADGRNAHLIVESPNWWLEKLLLRFNIISFATVGQEKVVLNPVSKGVIVLVEAKK